MTTKLIGLAAIALTSAVISMGTSAHVAGGALVDGNGVAVSSSFEKCVVVADGSHSDKCLDAKAAAAPEAVVQSFSLAGDALFDTNSDVVKDAGKAALDKFAWRAKRLNIKKIKVVGHADSRGDDKYNLNLSLRRANAVKSYLKSQGIAGQVISIRGKGESQPVASNDTASGRAQNRRVDIDVTGTKK